MPNELSHGLALDHVATGIVLADTQAIRYANAAALQLLGQPDLVGCNLESLAFPCLNEAGEPLSGSVLATLLSQDTSENVLGVFAEQQWRWLLLTTAPWPDSALRLLTLHDITAQRQVTCQLRQTNTLMRSLLDQVQVGIVVFDAAQQVVLVNDTWRQFFAVTDIQACISHAELWATVPEGEVWYGRLCAVMAAGQPWQSTLLTLPNRQSIIAEYQPLLDQQHLWSFRDMTLQEQTLRQYQVQTDQERLLAEVALHIRQFLDVPQILREAVAELQRCLGSDRVLVYRYIYDEPPAYVVEAEQVKTPYPVAQGVLLPAARIEPDSCAMQNPLTVVGDVSQVRVPPLIRSYLTQLQVQAYVMASIWIEDKLWGVLIVQQCDSPREWQPWEQTFVSRMAIHVGLAIQQAQVYTQAKQLNVALDRQVRVRTAQLNQQLQELQRLTTLKDDFFSGASHELRSPLTNMKLALQLLDPLLMEVPAAVRAKLERYLGVVRDECARELDLVNDLLDLQAVVAGQSDVTVEPVELHQLLAELIPPFRDRAENQQVSITEIGESVPLIYSDPALISRILRELLHNACKYTEPGQTIAIATATHQRSLSITVSNPATLPAEAVQRLFERFYRVPGGDRQQRGGTGLGLAIAKGLAEQLGGSLKADYDQTQLHLTLRLPL